MCIRVRVIRGGIVRGLVEVFVHVIVVVGVLCALAARILDYFLFAFLRVCLDRQSCSSALSVPREHLVGNLQVAR